MWTEQEKNYKCEGQDRKHRTFEKIIDHSNTKEIEREIKVKKMEETIIK